MLRRMMSSYACFLKCNLYVHHNESETVLSNYSEHVNRSKMPSITFVKTVGPYNILFV